MKTEKTAEFGSLSEDVICALIARNEVRKLNHTPMSSPLKFTEFFNKFARSKKGDSDVHTAELERKRKVEIESYVAKHLTHYAIKDGVSVPVGIKTE